MKEIGLQKAVASLIDLSLLVLSALGILFISIYFLPSELRSDYIFFVAKIFLLLLVLFYYLLQFFSSLTGPTIGQHLMGIRRTSPGLGASFIRFFLLGALPMVLFVVFSLWPLLFLPLVLPLFTSSRNNIFDEKMSTFFVVKEEKDLLYKKQVKGRPQDVSHTPPP